MYLRFVEISFFTHRHHYHLATMNMYYLENLTPGPREEPTSDLAHRRCMNGHCLRRQLQWDEELYGKDYF